MYIASATDMTARWLVSSAGGVQPIWSADGRSLYYLGLDGTVYSVSVDTDDRRVRPGTPAALFRSSMTAPSAGVEQFRVSADGERFVLRVPAGDDAPPPLRVVLNWPALLEKSRPAVSGEQR